MYTPYMTVYAGRYMWLVCVACICDEFPAKKQCYLWFWPEEFPAIKYHIYMLLANPSQAQCVTCEHMVKIDNLPQIVAHLAVPTK